MSPFSWSAWLEGQWQSIQKELGLDSPRMTELVRFVQPTGPFQGPADFLAPLVGLAAALAGLVLAGVALASLGTLLASLLGLGFLLTEVFGLTIEVDESRLRF